MFFFTYLARELRRRMRQAVFIALGLAIGVGLVLTVTAASAGVKNAQADVLNGLYGVGTDITVTGAAPKPPTTAPNSNSPSSKGTQIMMGPNGAEMCVNGKCHSLKNGYTMNQLGIQDSAPISVSDVAKIAALHDVQSAVGGLSLNDNKITISTTNLAPPASFTVFGTDVSDMKLGPISNATLSSGRTFTASDANKNVAVVDKDYATSNKLKVGGTVSVGGTALTIIGLVTQPEGATPPNVYIPLARAQALGSNPLTGGGNLTGDVNTIYVAATSAADIAAVQGEIAKIVPTATITTPSSLASEITGSLSSATKLANDLGKWLSILVLIAAFVVAALLTMAGVARRVREFGTLKALGWRGRRIIAQVMAESLAVGVVGAAAGVGLGFAGAAIINAVAPKLSATLPSQTGAGQLQQASAGGGGAVRTIGGATSQTVSVPMHSTIDIAAIAVAVALAVAGGLLAGAFGSWRTGRLRPADALSKVG
jgi:putative ABC transport system permease protein